MLRGVLVVFTYIVALAPNESFEVYGLIILFFIILIFIMRILVNYEIDFSIISVNLWINYLGIISLFLVGFLLGVILLVVSLRYIGDGAFRVKWFGAWIKG